MSIRSTANTLPGVLVIACLLAGCGLGMSNADRLDRADEAVANGEYRAAVIDLRDVLRRDASNVRARAMLGRLSIDMGDYATAEKEIRRAIELGANPTELHVALVASLVGQGKFQEALDAGVDRLLEGEAAGELRRLRGDTFLGLQQPAEARREYELALEASPNDVRGHLGIAAAYVAAGNPEQARINLDQLMESFPDEARVWLASGDLNRAAGMLDNAAANYEVVLKLAGETFDSRAAALTGLIEIAFANGDRAAAKHRVDQLTELAPESLVSQLARARLAALDEDWQQAQTLLQEILSLAPDFRPAQLLLGAVSYETGRFAQSEMYLTAVLADEPNNISARLMLAETLLAAGKREDAQRIVSMLDSGNKGDPRVLAMSAKIALSAGDSDRAIRALEQSIEADPMNTAAQLQLALALIGAGRQDEVAGVLDRLAAVEGDSTEFQRDVLTVLIKLRGGNADDALADARQLTDKWPNEPGGFNLIGAIHFASRNLEDARSSFLTALEKDADNPFSQRFLAQIAEASGNLDEAKDRYEQIIQADTTATWAMYGRARVAAAAEDFGESVHWLQRIVDVEPSSMVARETLARVHAQVGSFDAASTLALELIALDPSRVESRILLGDIELAAQNYTAAIAGYEEARRLDPTNAKLRLRLADAQRLAGDQAAAIATLGGDDEIDYLDLRTASATALAFANVGNYQRAMEIAQGLRRAHPESAGPIAVEGELWIMQGEFSRAAAAFEQALAIDLNQALTVRHYQVLRQLGDPDAKRSLRRYLQSNPDDTTIKQLLAQDLNQSGATSESISVYEGIVSTDPVDGVALNNLAWLYYTIGDDRAVETARKARKALPGNWQVLDTLGWVLVEAGLVEEGIGVLKEADALSAGESVVRYHLAAAYARAGDVEGAKLILVEVLASKADFEGRVDAERLLAEL